MIVTVPSTTSLLLGHNFLVSHVVSDVGFLQDALDVSGLVLEQHIIVVFPQSLDHGNTVDHPDGDDILEDQPGLLLQLGRLGGEQAHHHVGEDDNPPRHRIGPAKAHATPPPEHGGILGPSIVIEPIVLAGIIEVQIEATVDATEDHTQPEAHPASPQRAILPDDPDEEGGGDGGAEVLLDRHGEGEQVDRHLLDTYLPDAGDGHTNDDADSSGPQQLSLGLPLGLGQNLGVKIVRENGGEGVDHGTKVGHQGSNEASDHQPLKSWGIKKKEDVNNFYII